jgi:RNA polymerase sigma-70 factor (ECF subfamily)
MASKVDSDRLRVAWDEHKDRLWRAVLASSGDADVASDAVAEAFAQAARRGEAIDDIGRWVWRAAFRIAAGLLVERREVVSNDAGAPELRSADSLPEEVVGLLDALDRLRAEDRLVVVLAHVGGWSSAEIGELTGATAGATRVRLHRARRQLRRELEVEDG